MTMKSTFGFFVSILAAFLAAAFVTALSEPALADNYEQEIDEWYQARVERLKSPEGYLTLAGLFPLADGDNRFGSAEDNDLVFPAKAPAQAGVFTLKDGGVWIEVHDGAGITYGGAPVRSMKLETDAQEEMTVLEMGSLRFFVIERSGRLYIRLKDLESELLEHFENIDRFPVDAAWRIEGRFEPYDPPKMIRVPNVLGYEFVEKCPGAVTFDVGGTACRLEPMGASGGRLFFVFGDATSGLETYGGGRFMVAEAPAEDGTVVLDFNKAYNPPCAFTPFATCPLPHPANLLSVGIEAGEKKYGDDH
jgi:uncharacterized protein (DUF1684 family)